MRNAIAIPNGDPDCLCHLGFNSAEGNETVLRTIWRLEPPPSGQIELTIFKDCPLHAAAAKMIEKGVIFDMSLDGGTAIMGVVPIAQRMEVK